MLLKHKKGIIFGALDEHSIAWQTALQAHNEGAEMILTNMPAAIRLGKIKELAQGINAPVIPCDVENMEDVESLVEKSKIYFGGSFDFILHAIGMSMNIRKKRAYTAIDYGHFLKTIDVSALSLHKILQACFSRDALNEKGSVVTLSFIASQKAFPNYNDMAEAKATLESVVRNFGYYYGRHNGVRVNSVSQSPTPTSAAQNIEGFDAFYQNAAERAPLGNASAQDCAKFICALFSDYTQKVTMQNLYHDGGFSATGM
jgi:enoyl-[acyl-carrier protein] reductase I